MFKIVIKYNKNVEWDCEEKVASYLFLQDEC